MTTRVRVACWLPIAALLMLPATAFAQQATITPGLGSVGSSFSEQIGLGWRFNGPRVQAGFGPMEGPAGGFSLRGGSGPFRFNLHGAQGSTRSLGSQAASVTTLNGQPGYFFAGRQRPFVTGLVPVVGGRATGVSPIEQRVSRLRAEGVDLGRPRSIQERTAARDAQPRPAQSDAPTDGDALRLSRSQTSSAGQAAPGLAEIRRQQRLADEAQQREAEQHFQLGRQAERDGKLGVARYHYNIARRRDNGTLESQIAERIAELEYPRDK